ncbi:hypothetical protein Q604_UNBC02340G0001, partial [human gut metagenome]
MARQVVRKNHRLALAAHHTHPATARAQADLSPGHDPGVLQAGDEVSVSLNGLTDSCHHPVLAVRTHR